MDSDSHQPTQAAQIRRRRYSRPPAAGLSRVTVYVVTTIQAHSADLADWLRGY